LTFSFIFEQLITDKSAADFVGRIADAVVRLLDAWRFVALARSTGSAIPSQTVLDVDRVT